MFQSKTPLLLLRVIFLAGNADLTLNFKATIGFGKPVSVDFQIDSPTSYDYIAIYKYGAEYSDLTANPYYDQEQLFWAWTSTESQA